MLSVFFSSKCSLFHNSNVFGSRIIHILYTGCAKIKKKSGAKKLINISPPFRMEVAVSETCLYAVGGVRNIDKFYEVYINLITNESPFDSWQLAYHKCQITRYVAPQTKCCILYIYSTNIGTEYFKHGTYSPIFSLQNTICFIILKYLIRILTHFIYRMC